MPAPELSIHPGRKVVDELLLVSLPGAVDYLVADLGSLPGVRVARRWPDAVLVHYSGPVGPLSALRYFSSCAVWLDAPPPSGGPVELGSRFDSSLTEGLLAAVMHSGPPSFRVADIGPGRWPLRDHLSEQFGWTNAPGAWQVNLAAAHGSLVAEIGALHQTARFGELARVPASTTPVIAAVLVRLAKVPTGAVVLDPFCGAGTNLVLVASSAPGVRLVGLDLSPAALAGTRANLSSRGVAGTLAIADAGRLPLPDGSVDRVVANLPFGKRSGTHTGNVDLYPAFARQLTRVLRPDGRAVLLTEEKRLVRAAVQRTAGLRVIKEVEFESGGLHPSAYVVIRGRGRSRGRF